MFGCRGCGALEQSNKLYYLIVGTAAAAQLAEQALRLLVNIVSFFIIQP